MDARPMLPPAGAVELPDRGLTWLYDSGPAPGPTVVLLHGWMSTAALNWYRCFEALSERGRVVALDHRGHGRGIQSRRPFRLEACADDVAALIQTLDLGQATIVGYSMGGPIAQLVWRRHPDVVGGLVLCATAASFDGKLRWRGPLGVMSLGLSLAISSLPRGVRQFGMDLAIRNLPAERASAVWTRDEWRRHDPAALMQAGLALSHFDSTGWIASIDVPAAVVVTAADKVVSPRRQMLMCESIPGAVAIPVQGGHRVCVDQPDLFVPALLEGLESVADRQAAA